MTTTWSRDEILKLIEVWGDDNIQAQLNGCKHNQDIFDKISSALLEAGFVRSGSQCRDKIKKSRGKYRTTIIMYACTIMSYPRSIINAIITKLMWEGSMKIKAKSTPVYVYTKE